MWCLVSCHVLLCWDVCCVAWLDSSRGRQGGVLLSEAGALVVRDGVGGLEALQVLSQAVVFSLQLHQLGLPPHPAPLQLPPLLPLTLDLPGQVVHHRLKRTCNQHIRSLSTDSTLV